MSDITINEFAVKDLYTYVDEILIQDSYLDMASLHIDSLFINIPLDKTPNIYLKKLLQNPETLVNVWNDFHNLLNLATKE